MTVDTLFKFKEFTNLSKSEQKSFLDEVLAYLHDSDDMGEIPAYVMEENRRRLADYDSGKSEGIPYKKALAHIRSQIKAS